MSQTFVMVTAEDVLAAGNCLPYIERANKINARLLRRALGPPAPSPEIMWNRAKVVKQSVELQVPANTTILARSSGKWRTIYVESSYRLHTDYDAYRTINADGTTGAIVECILRSTTLFDELPSTDPICSWVSREDDRLAPAAVVAVVVAPEEHEACKLECERTATNRNAQWTAACSRLRVDLEALTEALCNVRKEQS